jgi:hypothetical protein
MAFEKQIERKIKLTNSSYVHQAHKIPGLHLRNKFSFLLI